MALTGPITSSAASAYTPGVTPNNPNAQLKTDDFMNLLITQLKNQDPLEPMKNNELLEQVSQIGNLQSQQNLTASLQDMVLQNQISAGAGMIGKKVAGLDTSGRSLTGVVTSIRVVDKKVVLELDTGKRLELGRVTNVAASSPASATGPAEAPLFGTGGNATTGT